MIFMSDGEKQPSFESSVRQMSHELRTPLTSIMGFSELLLEDETITGQNREYLTVISEESHRLSAMLNHYLSVLVVDSGESLGGDSSDATDTEARL